MALYDQRIVDKMDLKIFVNTDDDIRLSRRIMRDVAERGRTVESVIEAYNKFVKPSYDGFIRPTMKSADIIIPRGKHNRIAIDLVVDAVTHQLKSRSWTLYENLIEESGVLTPEMVNKNHSELLPLLLKSILTNQESEEALNQVFLEKVIKILHETLRTSPKEAEQIKFVPELITQESLSSFSTDSETTVATLFLSPESAKALESELKGKRVVSVFYR